MPALRLALPGDAPSLAVLAERTFRDAFGARNSPENMDLHCAGASAPTSSCAKSATAAS